jgi:hypothetical protein
MAKLVEARIYCQQHGCQRRAEWELFTKDDTSRGHWCFEHGRVGYLRLQALENDERRPAPIPPLVTR